MKMGNTPFGACIVKGSQVISCSHNQVWKDCDITAHAEVTAIRAACKKWKAVDLSGCVIYSTCEPCPMCFAACHWAGISKIIYGAAIQDARRIGFNELSLSNKMMKRLGKTPMTVQGGFLRKECLELFQKFETLKTRRIY